MNFNERIIQLNLNPKKEITKIVLINFFLLIASSLILVFFFNIQFLLMSIALIVFINYYLFRLTAVKRQQITELKELVMEIDPAAFVIVQEAHQVLGDGFSRYHRNAL